MFVRNKASQRYLWNGCYDCVLFAVYGLTTPHFHALGDLKLRGSSFATTAGFFSLLFPVYCAIYRTFDT